jgi:LuxR family transcriptional regulator
MLDYLRELAASTSLEHVWELHCNRMAGYGFDRLIYGYSRFVGGGVGAEIDDAIFLSNHDPDYFEQFVGERMFIHAPMTRWARQNYGACSWGKMWNNIDALSEEERRVVAFNRQMGVVAGYTISFADASPRAFGVIALTARPGLDQAAVDRIWAKSGDEIEAMNHVAHLKILSLPHATMRARLSDRQREVLEWVGEGKSNQDIATILGVSVPTVEKHLRLARDKMGVETTAQAILKASFQNQIYVL